MTAINLLLDPGMLPFTGALMLVAGFLVIELVMSLVGASMIGDAGDGADIDGIDAIDAPDGAPDMGDGAPDLADGALEGDIGMDAEGIEIEGAEGGGATGAASWLGFGEVPFILWLSGLLTAFGVTGYVLQLLAQTTLGTTVSWPFAAALALAPSLWTGGRFARLLGRLVPKTESSAISRRSLGGRRAIIVQGTAQRGRPAQARLRDGHGNLHYVRVEPADDHVEIPAQTEVLILDGRGPVLFAIPLNDIET